MTFCTYKIEAAKIPIPEIVTGKTTIPTSDQTADAKSEVRDTGRHGSTAATRIAILRTTENNNNAVDRLYNLCI